MAKTPDEIKKGLRQCGENTWCDDPDCPYYEIPECHTYIAKDALALIQQLERERDAAVEDLSAYRPCDACGLYELQGDNCFRCRRYTERPFWKWRGVQEVE